jgi:hypothetical protein
MKRYLVLLTLAVSATAQQGQQVQQEIRVEKFAIQHDGSPGPGPEPAMSGMMAGMIGLDGRMGVLSVTGKPFSATESRRTVQMLANGTKLESSDSNQFYRDDQGRTRVEQTVNGRTVTVIMDPVARFVMILDRETKSFHKNPIPADIQKGSVSVDRGKVTVRLGSIKGGPGPQQLGVANLGDKEVNGVTATGTRETRTIPVGAIGNDHPLEIVDERWFSSDLQVLVRSVNSDPRFGDTTYQLSNIVRGMQDPSLFQIPGDYSQAK